LLRDPKFLIEEKSAPILDRNSDYLTPERVEYIIERTRDWPKLVGGKQGFKVENVGETSSNRIITLDAERTYHDKERRKTLVKILSCYDNRFNDYHQALSLVSGFLLLSMSEQDVANIVTALATNPKYIPEYWCAECIAGARDAYVWDYLVQKHVPEVSAHLKKCGVFPEAFCQKWFVSLTVNVLPFRILYRFFEHFLSQGYIYSLKFGLLFVSTCKNQLLKSRDYEIFSILRYDKKLDKGFEITDDTMYDIVERAATFSLGDFNVTVVRDQVFNQYLKPRLERVKQQQQQQENEDVESDLSDSSEEEGAECGLCTENAPDMWCLTCKQFVCEKCHSSNAKNHKKTHKVDENWGKYEGKNDD